MEKTKIRKIYGLMVLGAFLCFLPSIGLSQPCTATVVGGSSYPSINAALNAAGPFATINVSGTCNEIVQILANKNHITLNGGGTATITCQSPAIPPNVCATQGNVAILGKSITITAFNITGGIAGIQVVQGASATINSNTIYDTARNGIVVVQNSFASIINNTIHDIGLDPNFPFRGGIQVADSSSAYIGYSRPTDTVASPNIIRNNPTGILLRSSASARIVGNEIINNAGDGIMVIRGSQADISDNIIDGNGQNGIFVSQGSGVNLGNDTGDTILDLPNSGTNGDKGLSCSIGGYVDGRLGALKGTGKHHATKFTKGCIDSLIP